MRFLIALVALALGLLRAPLLSAPVDVTASSVAEVIGSDIFAQTLEVKTHDGQVETVPFSKWTDFFKSKVAIDPSDIRIGDHVRILLDSNEATAVSIVVIPRRKARELASILTANESVK
jgi:hypothetical protein